MLFRKRGKSGFNTDRRPASRHDMAVYGVRQCHHSNDRHHRILRSNLRRYTGQRKRFLFRLIFFRMFVTSVHCCANDEHHTFSRLWLLHRTCSIFLTHHPETGRSNQFCAVAKAECAVQVATAANHIGPKSIRNREKNFSREKYFDVLITR